MQLTGDRARGGESLQLRFYLDLDSNEAKKPATRNSKERVFLAEGTQQVQGPVAEPALARCRFRKQSWCGLIASKG